MAWQSSRAAKPEPTTPPTSGGGAAAEQVAAPIDARADVAVRRAVAPVALRVETASTEVHRALPSPVVAEPPAYERPDDLSAEQKAAREMERSWLEGRFHREAPESPQAVEVTEQVTEVLGEHGFDAALLAAVDCRQSMCRLELRIRGADASEIVPDVNRLIGAARAFTEETWLLASETAPGSWNIEVFMPTRGHTLTGPGESA